ncbi:HAD family hydrolase [Devosia honganensis]|uniref:HAD family hydrolase n=1 Tax=Devosia honganensis TaxID=1610527 RepID=A0ABV7X198_9HYPH
MIDLVIFDFDGVVVDSEVASNGLLAEIATELGHPMDMSGAVRFFGGSTLFQQLEKLAMLAGGKLPEDFGTALQERTMSALAAVQPLPGLEHFLDWLGPLPICIGSTSAPERIEFCLDAAGLSDRFSGNVFSVSMVGRNKPAPDIFLHAAERMGTSPQRCLVIEDSPHGVVAGRAAGMGVIGLAAASHLAAGHPERLLAAGADHVAESYGEVRQLMQRHFGFAAAR